MYRRPVLAFITLLVSACSSTPEQPASATPVSHPETRSNDRAPAPETGAQREERVIRDLSSKSIYFDSGSDAIKPEYRDTIEQVSHILVSAPQVSITLLGSADERGKTNRVLAQKRAEAVKRALVQSGIAGSRIAATGQGMKPPRTACHDKKCRAENQRVDLIFRGVEATTK